MSEQQTIDFAQVSAQATKQARYWICKQCLWPFRDDSGQEPCPKCDQSVAEDFAVIKATEMTRFMREYNEKQAKQTKSAHQSTPTLYTPPRYVAWSLGAVGIAIGLVFWLEAARHSLAGAVGFTNWIIERLNVPHHIAMPTAWPWLVALSSAILLGLVFKFVEIDYAPFHIPTSEQFLNVAAWRASSEWDVWLVWIVIITIDVGAIYGGLQSESASESVRFLREISQNPLTLVLYAILITFLPDRLIRLSWRRIFPEVD